ncbi:hypothetical protein [Paraburkholderia humisilvae]|uniref:Uncharacterized protein n=1 Tax=Paraburkholderia humisilvae TaxID=627669 RepID=A0A6J5F9P7_9BURK|nr:hypothetical protein LMG29542_07525 [Paraburkholderia humisilvae]
MLYFPFSEATPDIGQHDASVEPLEAWLARKILPLGLPVQSVLPNRFTRGIERVYSPARGFWHNIHAERFVDELERCEPTYLADIAAEWSGAGCGSFRDDVINEIRTKQFDEYSATFLLSVPNLSDDDEKVYDLLERHLRKARADTHLRYLELDGVKAIGHIRDMMDQLWEHAHPDCV